MAALFILVQYLGKQLRPVYVLEMCTLKQSVIRHCVGDEECAAL